MKEIAAKVKAIIADMIAIDENEVTPATSLTNDLGFDSLDTVGLIIKCEKEFGIRISDEDVEKIGTVGDAIYYIEKEIAE